MNIEASYEARDLDPAIFDEEVLGIIRGYDGFNITIPFKDKILQYLDLDRGAAEIGAVNCVFDGKGYNTDWIGFIRSLQGIELIPPVMVIGAGGAARAIVYGLYRMGIHDLHLMNRTQSKAEELSQSYSKRFGMKIYVHPFSALERMIKRAGTLINATSVGLKGEHFNVTPETFSDVRVLFDVIYTKTPLQRLAVRQGIKVVMNGRSMLYHQAVENLRIWGILKEDHFHRIFEEVTS